MAFQVNESLQIIIIVKRIITNTLIEIPFRIASIEFTNRNNINNNMIYLRNSRLHVDIFSLG